MVPLRPWLRTQKIGLAGQRDVNGINAIKAATIYHQVLIILSDGIAMLDAIENIYEREQGLDPPNHHESLLYWIYFTDGLSNKSLISFKFNKNELHSLES